MVPMADPLSATPVTRRQFIRAGGIAAVGVAALGAAACQTPTTKSAAGVPLANAQPNPDA